MNDSHLTCRLRQAMVAATPEEKVRQRLIAYMIDHLGFLPHTLLIEKELRQLPHIDPALSQMPQRRFDLLVLEADIHPQFPLYPLLVIECKAVKIKAKERRQLEGYNHYLRAPFICLVNDEEILTGQYHFDLGRYHFENGLPVRKVLLDSFTQ